MAKSLEFFCLLAVLLAAIATAAVIGSIMVQGDTLWHIRAGEWALAHKVVPEADMFSWTAPGVPWHAQSWLWEVLAALLWDAAGKWGVWFLMALGVVLAGVFSFLLAVRRSGSPAWALACSVVSLAVLPVFLSARPHVLALGFFILWLWLLDASRERRWAAPFLPFLAVLWANIHASAPLGVAAGAALLAADRFLCGRFPVRRQVIALAAGAVAVNLNPWGFGIWGYMVSASSYPEITEAIFEWASPNFHVPQLWPVLGMAAALVLLWPRTDRSLRYLALGAFLAGLMSVRHLALFLMLWPAAVVPACASTLRLPGPRVVLAGAGATAAAFAFLAAASLPPAWLERPQEREFFPVRAVAYMKEHGLTERVFNHYSWGGYLIWEGVRPFIDGRADMYVFSGSKVFDDYKRAAFPQDPDPDGVFAERGVEVVLIPTSSWLALYLSRHPEWEKVYADEVAVVFRKE